MDIDKTLEDVKQKVRLEKSRDLKPSPFDFYDAAAQAVKNMEAEMMRIGRPRSVEYKMLEDELSGLVTNVETVFMTRVGKVVERATSGAFTNSSAALLKKDVDKLLPAEQELYDDVLKAILKARTALIADFIDADHGEKEMSSNSGRTVPAMEAKSETKSETKPETTAETKAESKTESRNETAVDLKGETKAESRNDTAVDPKGETKTESSANLINENYVLVRILKDLPEFMGEDKRSYHLKTQDVVSLPAINANLLIKRGVAMNAQNIPGSSEGNPES
jgi:DNA replication factor GINS